MVALRIFLGSLFCGLSVYTLVVISHHGMGLLPIFFGDMLKMEWPGQFNADFSCFLLMSGLWVAWRHHFTLGGLALSLLAVLGGALFLTAYLFINSFLVKNINALLLGETRATSSRAT